MSCGICGLPGDASCLLADGRSIGATCGADECGALLWESAVLPPGDAEERRLLAWRIRRRVAAVRGRPFREPSPVDAELARAYVEFEELKRLALEGDTDAVPGV